MQDFEEMTATRQEKRSGNEKKDKRGIKREKSFGEWEIISIFAIPFGKAMPM